MAVVELGTWNVRAGYIGDTHCSHSLRALQCVDYPAITDITSMLITSSYYSCNRYDSRVQQEKDAPIMHSFTEHEKGFTNDSNNRVHAVNDSDANRFKMQRSQECDMECVDISNNIYSTCSTDKDLLSLWSLSSYESNKDVHHAYIRRIHKEVLRCASNDPLLLVVPEEWWQPAHHKTLSTFCESLLESFDHINEEENHDSNNFCAEANISAIYCMRPSVCWTLASGLTSAVVLDVGHSHSTVAAVLDGYTLIRSVQSSPIAGCAVTCAMQSLLSKETLESLTTTCFSLPQSHNIPYLCRENTPWMMEVMSSVKHIYGYVQNNNSTVNTTKELKENNREKLKVTFELPLNNGVWVMPDGHSITLSDYVRCAPYELLFCKHDSNNFDVSCNNKEINDSSCDNSVNVAEMMALCKAQMDVEWQLHGIHHLLTGGCGCSSVNFYHRLIDELKTIDSAYYRYDRDGFMHNAQSDAAAWVGASMAAESSALEPLWITKSEYDECGHEVLYRKLFL